MAVALLTGGSLSKRAARHDGASVSWGHPRTSACGDHAGLGWLEKLKDITNVNMQLEVDWTFLYQGYSGTCNSGPQNSTIKLEK